MKHRMVFYDFFSTSLASSELLLGNPGAQHRTWHHPLLQRHILPRGGACGLAPQVSSRPEHETNSLEMVFIVLVNCVLCLGQGATTVAVLTVKMHSKCCILSFE